jgi:SNF2 family DNA or RNA helicase
MDLTYEDFLEKKSQLGGQHGFDPLFMPDGLFPFQKHMVEWAVRKGRGALFEDCGLGKSFQSLVWAQNVVQKENKPVLIATPLAVSYQFLREGEKFGIQVKRSIDGKINSDIVVTNYQRLHYFNPDDFAGMVCDESGILKNYDGKIKDAVTIFMRKMKYRLLCTGTPAPNDTVEIGTSSEALGELGYMDMLSRFFKNEQNTNNPNRLWADGGKWRFKPHAEQHFWKWMCSWCRALRKPSDFGFSDDGYILPELIERTHIMEDSHIPNGMLFAMPVKGLREERIDAKQNLERRCEKIINLCADHERSLIFCNTNPEGDFLEKELPDAVQVSGSDPDEKKEEVFLAFADGKIKRCVTKPKIGAFGLNLQVCGHIAFFPSHSFEQRYQGIRRCYRFGRNQPVYVDTVASKGESLVIENQNRKERQADYMFEQIVRYMNNELGIKKDQYTSKNIILPSWM